MCRSCAESLWLSERALFASLRTSCFADVTQLVFRGCCQVDWNYGLLCLGWQDIWFWIEKVWTNIPVLGTRWVFLFIFLFSNLPTFFVERQFWGSSSAEATVGRALTCPSPGTLGAACGEKKSIRHLFDQMGWLVQKQRSRPNLQGQFCNSLSKRGALGCFRHSCLSRGLRGFAGEMFGVSYYFSFLFQPRASHEFDDECGKFWHGVPPPP